MPPRTASLSLKVATSGNEVLPRFVQWAASMGSQGTIWFRLYGYFTAKPPP